MCCSPKIRAIINVIVLNVCLLFASSSVFTHVIPAVHSFSTSIELFHTLLLLSTALQHRMTTTTTKKKNKKFLVVWLWLQTLHSSFFSSSWSYCFDGDLFTVCCFIHPTISFLPLLYVTSKIQNIIYEAVCVFVFEWKKRAKEYKLLLRATSLKSIHHSGNPSMTTDTHTQTVFGCVK